MQANLAVPLFHCVRDQSQTLCMWSVFQCCRDWFLPGISVPAPFWFAIYCSWSLNWWQWRCCVNWKKLANLNRQHFRSETPVKDRASLWKLSAIAEILTTLHWSCVLIYELKYLFPSAEHWKDWTYVIRLMLIIEVFAEATAETVECVLNSWKRWAEIEF